MTQRALLLGIAILGLGLATRAEAENAGVYFFGIGAQSCATWLSKSAYQAEGEIWIFGAWSALNVTNASNKYVGSTTDGAGIAAAVMKTCKDDPSIRLVDATVRVYREFQEAGR